MAQVCLISELSNKALPKLNESTIIVIKELADILTLFTFAAVPTLLLALHWSV